MGKSEQHFCATTADHSLPSIEISYGHSCHIVQELWQTKHGHLLKWLFSMRLFSMQYLGEDDQELCLKVGEWQQYFVLESLDNCPVHIGERRFQVTAVRNFVLEISVTGDLSVEKCQDVCKQAQQFKMLLPLPTPALKAWWGHWKHCLKRFSIELCMYLSLQVPFRLSFHLCITS